MDQGTAPADRDQDSAWAAAEDQAARELVVVVEPAEAVGAAVPACGNQVCREEVAAGGREPAVGPARDRAAAVVMVVVELGPVAEVAAQVEEDLEAAAEAQEPAEGREPAVATVVELGPVAEVAAQVEEDLEAAAEAQEPAAEWRRQVAKAPRLENG